METSPVKSKDSNLERIFQHIFDNGMGNPIILSGVPTASQMKANTWGIYGSDLYFKFGNNVLLKFTGAVVS